MKLNKNDDALKELLLVAKQKGKALKDLLRDDTSLEDVCKIFYKHMPKVIKWSMSFDKFKVFYVNNRETFIQQIPEIA